MPFEQDGGSFPGTSNTKSQRCIPVACRVVPMDQWFTTHIDQTWYVQDLKIWLLSKALPPGVLPLPASYRPSSPVLFATDAGKPGTHSTSALEGKAKDELDFDVLSLSTNDIADEFYTTHYIPNNNVNSDSATRSGLQAIAPYSYKRGEFISADKVSDPALLSKMIALSKRWQVYSFSTGMMLSDEVQLADYRLNPHYLFELHRTGDYISLPKELPHDFWNVNFSNKGDGGNFDESKSKQVPMWSYQQPYFDTWTWVFTALQVDKTSSGKDVAADAKQGNPGGGWKKAWILVKDGFLFLYHEKSDAAPVGKFDLGECVGLSGEDKIKPIVNSHFHGIDNNALGFVPHWRHNTPSQAPRNRNAKFAICLRFRRPYMVKQNSIIYTLLYENCSWLLLDFPDRTTHEHLLRVLHRLMYFNPALVSDNLPLQLYPRRTLQTDFLPNQIHPPQPIRFARASSPVSTIADDDSLSSKTTIGSLSQLGLGDSFGVRFPEWREQVLRRAMVSTHGYSFEGMMWSKLPKTAVNNYDYDLDADLRETNFETGYDSPSSDTSNGPSELEWKGWAYDLDRPKKASSFFVTDERSSMDSGRQFTEEQSIYSPRNRTQSVFSLSLTSSKQTPGTEETTTLDTTSTSVIARTRSSTVSLKKPSFISPKSDSIPLPGVAGESSTSSHRFMRAFGGKSFGK